MEYSLYAQNTTFNAPQSSVQWVSPVPPNTPLQAEAQSIPGLTYEDLMPLASSGMPSCPPLLDGINTASLQAPTTSAYSAAQSGYVEQFPNDAAQVLQYLSDEANEARSRFLRRQKTLLREKLESWSYLQHHNQMKIPLQSVRSLLFPYGDISDSEVISFWGIPSRENCAYLVTSQLSGGFQSSYSVVIPSLQNNLIPFAIAEALDPTVTRSEESVVTTPELGNISTYGDIFLTVRLGGDKLLMGFTMTTSSQVVVFGETACNAFGLLYCPIKNQLLLSSGEALSTIKVRTQWLQGP